MSLQLNRIWLSNTNPFHSLSARRHKHNPHQTGGAQGVFLSVRTLFTSTLTRCLIAFRTEGNSQLIPTKPVLGGNHVFQHECLPPQEFVSRAPSNPTLQNSYHFRIKIELYLLKISMFWKLYCMKYICWANTVVGRTVKIRFCTQFFKEGVR